MHRSKIIYSHFDKNTGVSTVKIQTPNGVFTGTSTLQEEDKDYLSEIAGCSYAEIKAHIKATNAQIKKLNSILQAFTNFYYNASTSKNFVHGDFLAKRLRAEIGHLDDKIANLTQLKEAMHQTLMNNIATRQQKIDAFHKKVNKLKGKNS